MIEWKIWFALAAMAVVLEMFTGTFYLLMIGIGLTVGGLLAWAGMASEVQLIVAGMIGMAATYGLRRSKLGRSPGRDARRDPNVNLDIGQRLTVNAWNPDGRTARAMYRGALWDVELEHGVAAGPGTFTIHEVRGSHLIVGSGKIND